MHIPDGFLDNRICLAAGALSVTAVGVSLRRLRPESEPDLTPRMGLVAAYIFAAQMVNFPVAAGTSGHLLGALLAAVLLGPSAATVVMTAVFTVQAFFFLDGGHTALGANLLNMGLSGTLGGYAVYQTIAGPRPARSRCLVAAGIAAWISVMLGAALTSGELALSGAAPTRLVLPAMLGVHTLIGLGEAAITVGALALVWRVRPELLAGTPNETKGSRWPWIAAGGLALVAALAPLASSAPDGLERVAQSLGFESRGAGAMLPGAFPDYSLPAVGAAAWAPIALSLLGSVIVLGVLLGMMHSRLSGLHAHLRIDPRVTFGGTLALVLTAVLLPAGQAGKLWMLGLLALLWAGASRVSLRWLAGRALLLIPLVGMAALSAFHRPGTALSFYGLAFLRAGISLLATAAFLAACSETEALATLTWYRLPRPLGQTIAFALRYFRVIGTEAGRMLQARASRSAESASLARRAGAAGGIVGSLFVRSVERSDRVVLAMASRGYQGAMPEREFAGLHMRDSAFALGLALFLVGVWVWG